MGERVARSGGNDTARSDQGEWMLEGSKRDGDERLTMAMNVDVGGDGVLLGVVVMGRWWIRGCWVE